MKLSMHNSYSNRPRIDKSKLAVRVIAFVLTALMIVGVAYYTIVLMAFNVHAADSDADTSGDMISVGLMYGDGVTISYPVTVVGGTNKETGVTVGLQSLVGKDKKYTPLWTMDSAGFVIAIDGNLSYSAATSSYVKTENENDYSVGGYHVELLNEFTSFDDAKTFCDTWSSGIADNCGASVFPAYINGEYKVRIGDTPSLESAKRIATLVAMYFSDYQSPKIVSPSSTCQTAINPKTNEIVFEFDNGNGDVLGIKPTDTSKYLKSPADNIYTGVFAFKNYKTAKAEGVSVINILPLEDYIAGVLPYEVSNTWPLETLKAFAIAVRSFTVNCFNLHYASYSFDLCSTTHCQAYRGVAQINKSVKQAVSETKGLVMTYNGKICTANYSSSVGGVTVGAKDAWGYSDYPYASAKRTPWEDYYHHANGFWSFEISPTKLLVYLRDTRGYSELKGTEITEVKVLEHAKNSLYVKTIKFTDNLGNSVTITNTDKVRTVLSTYAKSANFVVGKGSVEYFVDIVRGKDGSKANNSQSTTVYGQSDGQPVVNAGTATSDDEIKVITTPFKLTDYVVRTADSVSAESINMYVNIITADGTYRYGKSGINVICVENSNVISDPTKDTDDPIIVDPGEIIEDDNDFSIIQKMTAKASDSDNFIFVGKGWGHGVGMSQYGAYDLAVLGYSYDKILSMYFDNIKIENYKQ